MTLRIGTFHGHLSGQRQLTVPARTPLEFFVQQFPKELTRFSTLAGMAAGAGAFRLARYAALGLTGQGGIGGRLISATVGILAEAPIFNGVAGAVDRMGRASVDRAREDHWKEWGATATMLGSLRIFGFAGQRALALAAPVFGAGMVPVAFQMGGLHFAHQIQKKFGWMDSRLPDPSAADHLASIAQFTGMGMVVRGALGARWAAMERAADQKMEWRLSWPQLPGMNSLEPVWNGAGYRPTSNRSETTEKISNMVFSKDDFEGPMGVWSPGVSNGPLVGTPKNIFPQTYPGEIKDTGNKIYLEFGSQRDLSKDPKARDSIMEQSGLLRSLFSLQTEVTPGFFNGTSAKILSEYPGLLWGMKKDLTQAGHKLWIQFDVDRGILWNSLLLDGFDRPRHGLLTLPNGNQVLELKVDYYPSGFPQIQGCYFRIDPLQPGKLEAFQIRRVKFDDMWEEGLGIPQVMLGLFQKGSFTISMFHHGEIPVTIRYSIGDQKSQWEWSARPFFGPMLHLETRYEEYHLPSASALRKARPRMGNTPAPESVLATMVEPPVPVPAVPAVPVVPVPAPGPVAPEPRLVAAARFFERPKPALDFYPSPGDVLERAQFHLKRLQDGGNGKVRDTTRSLKALYYEVSTTDQLSRIHPTILEAVPFFLTIPLHGPSFLIHYARLVSPGNRMEILSKVQTQLSSHIPAASAGAFEVIQKFSPRLEGWERNRLLEEMERLHGKSPQWGWTISMVYQGRRALEEPPPIDTIISPTFL